MPKKSRKQVDIDEKALMRILQYNAKESFNKLAKRTGFSRQKIWRIITRLEKDKSIWGYHTIVDKEKIGVNTYFILLKRAPRAMKNLDPIVKNTLHQDGAKIGVELESMYYVHGPYDWVLRITATNIKQVKRFCELVLKTFLGYISDLQVMEVLYPIKKDCIDNPNPGGIRDFFLTE